MGDTTHKSVQDANCMVARVIVLLVLCQARKIRWVLEQPVNSLLAQHMMFQELLRMREVDVLTFIHPHAVVWRSFCQTNLALQ